MPATAIANNSTETPISVLFAIDAMHGGGAEKILSDLLKKLDRTKFRPALFVFTNTGIYLKDIPADIPVFSLFQEPSDYRGIQKFLRRTARSIAIRAIKICPPLMRLAAKFAKLPQKFDVGVSFCEGLNLLLFSGAPHRFQRRIAWIHTNMAQHKYVLGKNDYARAAQTIDKIVFVAQSALNIFQKIFPQIPATKLTQIYNPVDVEGIRKKAGISTTKNDSTNRPFQILAVGRLEDVKRFDRLIDALKLVRERPIDARLTILGSGGKLLALQQQATELGIAEFVKFIPFQENPYQQMAQADLLVSSSDYEGLPIVVTEAMTLGLPIVATKTTGALETLNANGGHYGILADFSPESLAEKIAFLLENSSERIRIKNALETSQRNGLFPFSSSIEKIEQLLLNTQL